jgi:hypothetical protein
VLSCASAAFAQVDLVDLIVVLDNSGSMQEEAAELQSALPGLVATLESRGLEVRLVLISASNDMAAGICLPAPIGSGSCPDDENLPGYRHVDVEVGSTSALSDILDHHDDFSASLRSGAHRSLLVVSDDDSAMSASTFTSQLLLHPGFDAFLFHAAALAAEPIPPFPPPGVCWRDGQDGTQGSVYLELVAMRGGHFHDYCVSEDLDPSWDPLSLTIAIFADGFESGDTDDWSLVGP